MAGLDPAIHAFVGQKDVDPRHKAGDDVAWEWIDPPG